MNFPTGMLGKLFSWAQLEPGNLSYSAGLFCCVLTIGEFTQPSNHTPRRPFCLGDCRDPSILQCSCPFQLLHTRKAPAVPALGYQVPALTLVVESITHPTPCWGSTHTYQMVSRFWRKKDIGVCKEIAKGLFG